jgi:hypothetical protein
VEDTRTATGTIRLLGDMDPLTTITPAANMLMGRHDRRGFIGGPIHLAFSLLISSTCRKSNDAAQAAAQAAHALRSTGHVLSALT